MSRRRKAGVLHFLQQLQRCCPACQAQVSTIIVNVSRAINTQGESAHSYASVCCEDINTQQCAMAERFARRASHEADVLKSLTTCAKLHTVSTHCKVPMAPSIAARASCVSLVYGQRAAIDIQMWRSRVKCECCLIGRQHVTPPAAHQACLKQMPEVITTCINTTAEVLTRARISQLRFSRANTVFPLRKGSQLLNS